jgi:aminoglycoside phosphotransferase (APT) family kinase protein
MATTEPFPTLGPRLGGGKAADVHAWGGDKIVKLYRDEVPNRLVEAEARNSHALHAAGLPAPRFFERVEIAGRRGNVFERVEGRLISASLQLNPFRLFRLARDFAAVHRLIHSTARPELPPVAGHLRRVIAPVSVLSAAQKDELNALLESLPGGSSVCHLDFHPGNVMLSPRGPIVLDWGIARSGNPLADVARSCVLFATDHLEARAAPVAKTWNSAFARIYLRCYFDGAAQTLQHQLKHWITLMAAAKLRKAGAREVPILMRLVERGLAAG